MASARLPHQSSCAASDPSIVISAKETVTTAAQATVRCEDRSGRSTTAKVTLEASPS